MTPIDCRSSGAVEAPAVDHRKAIDIHRKSIEIYRETIEFHGKSIETQIITTGEMTPIDCRSSGAVEAPAVDHRKAIDIHRKSIEIY